MCAPFPPLSDPDGQGEAAVRAGQPAEGAGEGAGQHDAVPAREGGLRGRRRAAAREEREAPGEKLSHARTDRPRTLKLWYLNLPSKSVFLPAATAYAGHGQTENFCRSGFWTSS